MIPVLRSLLYLLLATLITAPFGLFVTLAVVLPMKLRFALIAIWRAGFMALCKYVLGIDYRVIGRENIPTTPSVILSKHQSAWETVSLQAIFPPLVFVLKKSLLMIPFLGWAFAAVKMISIDRGAGQDALRQVVKQGCDRLAAGYWVVIFPEGTRIAPGSTRRFKAGGAHLAISAGALAVPVAHNAGEFWAKNAFVKTPGLITVSIGPAIDPRGKTADEVTLLAEQWIENEMRRISPHHYPEPATAHARATSGAVDAAR
jgi:1-acyl-sn-glycerol-3-phosphate acyltransferase